MEQQTTSSNPPSQGSGTPTASPGQTSPAPSSQPQTLSASQRIWGAPDDPQQASGEDQSSPSGSPAGGQQAGGGGSAASPPATQQPSVAESGQPAKIEFTEELLGKLAQSIGQSVRQNQPQVQQPEPMLTQEEFERKFNIFRPTQDMISRLRGEDEAVAMQTLTEMLHGAAKQATTIASYVIENQIKEVRALVEPALALAQEHQTQKMVGEFFKTYPDLKGFEPLLELVRDSLIAKGTKFNSQDEAFKTVAEMARNQIKTIPGLAGGLQQAGQTSGQPAQPNSGRQMPTLTSGKGQTGAGDASSSGSGKGKNTAERIFG